MSRDARRFFLVLAGVIASLCVLALVRSARIGRDTQRFEALENRRATQTEFEHELGPPDTKYARDGKDCWSYELDQNPRKTVCFDPGTGQLEDSTWMWIDE